MIKKIQNIVKLLTFTSIFAIFAIGINSNELNAQSLEFTTFDTKLNGRADQADVPVQAEFKNTSDNPIKVMCKMTVNNLVGSDEVDDFGNFKGHSATFCWGDLNDPVNPGLCYLASRKNFTSSFNLTIPAKSNSNPNWFKGYLYPSNYTGVSSVCYTIFNEDNENESATFCVEFNITTTSVESEAIGNIKLYPNPANNDINVELIEGELPNSIQLINSNGEVVMVKNISNNADLKIDTNNLNNGKYFYKLIGGKLNNTSIPFVVNK